MTEVNTEQLDALVLSYLGKSAEQGTSTAEHAELRQLLLGGAFPAAAARLRQLCPALADNQWLEFQMKKHQFMHMALSASSAGGDGSSSSEERQRQLHEALDLAKRELAPLALHAYCEAYSDFKHCMLALVSGGGNSSSSSAEVQEFAGMVVRAVRQETAGFDNTELAQLLRYLLLLHQHQHHSGFHPYWWPELSSQSLQLCTRLLLPQRDALPPPALEPAGGLSAGGVREHDVQALRTSLGCDREEAVTLLRRARGNAFRGLQDALQAAHIHEQLLAELAEEYAACRGLAPLPQQQAEQQRQQAGTEDMQVDEQQQRRPTKVARKGSAAGKGAEAAVGAVVEREEAEEEGQQQLELPAELSEQQLRQLLRQLEHMLSTGRTEQALQQLEAADPAFLPDHPAAAFALHRCRFLQLLPTDSAAALAYVRQHLSSLAQQHPDMLQPQLKAALALLLPLAPAPAAGSAGAADATGAFHQQQGVADAMAAVRTALRPRCRVREPRLLVLLRELLSLHAAHFKLQRCQDRFASELGIPALKAGTAAASGAPGAAAGAAPASNAANQAFAAAAAAAAAEAREALAAAAAAGGGHRAGDLPVPGVRVVISDSEDEAMMHEEDSDDEGSEGAGEGEEDDDDVGVPEQAILTVCEFTGLPRHTAIELLLVHGGDAAAVLAHVFP